MTSVYAILAGIVSLSVFFSPGWIILRLFRHLNISATLPGKVSLMVLISSGFVAIPPLALSLASLDGLKLYMLALTIVSTTTLPFAFLSAFSFIRRARSSCLSILVVGTVAASLAVILLSLSRTRVEWDAINYYLPDAFLYLKYDRIPFYNVFDFSGGSPVVDPPFGPLAYALDFVITGGTSSISQYENLVPALILIPTVFFLATLASVYELGMRIVGKSSFAMGATWVVASHPLVLRFFELTPLYVDAYFVFFALGALVWVADRGNRRGLPALFLASLSGSLSVLSKSFGIIAFVLLIVALLLGMWGVVEVKQNTVRRIWGLFPAIAALAVGCSAGLGWLFRNYILTGSPFAWGLPQLVLGRNPELQWAFETTQKAWAEIPRPGSGFTQFSVIMDPSVAPVLFPLILLSVALLRRSRQLLQILVAGLLFALFFVIVLQSDDIRHVMLLVPIEGILSAAGLEWLLRGKTMRSGTSFLNRLSLPILISTGLSGMVFSPDIPGLWYAITPRTDAYWFFYDHLLESALLLTALGILTVVVLRVSETQWSFFKLATVALIIWLIILPIPMLASRQQNQNYFDSLSASYYGYGSALQYLMNQPLHGGYLLTYRAYGVRGFTDLEPIDLADAVHLYKIYSVIHSSNLTWAFSQLQALGVVYAILPNLKAGHSNFVTPRFRDMTYNSAQLPVLVSLNNPQYWSSIEFGGWDVYTPNRARTGLGLLDVVLGDQSGVLGSVYEDGRSKFNTAEGASLSVNMSRILLYLDTSTLSNSPAVTITTINYTIQFKDGHTELNSTSTIGNSSASLISVSLQSLAGLSGAITTLFIHSITVSMRLEAGYSITLALAPINATAGFPMYLAHGMFTLDGSLSFFTYKIS